MEFPTSKPLDPKDQKTEEIEPDDWEPQSLEEALVGEPQGDPSY